MKKFWVIFFLYPFLCFSDSSITPDRNEIDLDSAKKGAIPLICECKCPPWAVPVDHILTGPNVDPTVQNQCRVKPACSGPCECLALSDTFLNPNFPDYLSYDEKDVVPGECGLILNPYPWPNPTLPPRNR